MTPDPRTLEDLAVAGARALMRAAREDAAARERIDAAAEAVLRMARDLREAQR